VAIRSFRITEIVSWAQITLVGPWKIATAVKKPNKTFIRKRLQIVYSQQACALLSP